MTILGNIPAKFSNGSHNSLKIIILSSHNVMFYKSIAYDTFGHLD